MNRLRRIFWRLAEVNTPSYSENRITPMVIKILLNSGFKVSMDEHWNIIASNGNTRNGEKLPLLCAHADTVNDSKGARVKLVYNNMRKVIHTSKFSEVLGGDDKCGIAIILRLAEMAKKDGLKFVVLITRGEEVGVGAGKLNESIFDLCEYSIVIDRRGSGDIVHNIYGQELCSKEFALWVEDMAPESIKTRKISSMHSDAAELAEWLEVVNLSCGYYDPHSDYEFVDVRDMHSALIWVKRIITTKYNPEKYVGLPFVTVDPYGSKSNKYGFGEIS